MNTHLSFPRGLARLATLLALTPLLLTGALFAGQPVEGPGGKEAKTLTIEDSWRLPGLLGAGVKTTHEYTEGNVFLVLPVVNTLGRDGRLSGDVLFLEPYSSWGEQGEVAVSLGFGWRHLFNDQSVSAITRHDGHQAGFLEEGFFIGANFFADMLDTQFDNQFWQLGAGLEAGTRYLEARANYYLPLNDRKLALEQRSKQSFSNTGTSTSQGATAVGAPFAQGNAIAQNASFTTRTTTTTSTTTIEQISRLFEEGMEGWDAEVALLVPGLDRYMDARLIGGYFSFDNQPFGPQTGGTGNVEGWKAGLEVRPVPAVVLKATWYEDERFVGSDWLFGAQLEIPFEAGNLGDGKGFWGRIAEAFTPRRRHLAERLAEPVHRQNQAIKVAHNVDVERNVSTSVKKETTLFQNTRRIVLLDDIIFVNSNGPTGNGIQTGSVAGTGTAERPQDTIQGGANIAQANSNATTRVWNVYTQGTGVAYTENVNATVGSVNFIGSGKLIQGFGGQTFGTGPAPLVDGGFFASIPFLGVTAYEITGGFIGADGIAAVDVGTVNILENNIHDVGGTGVFISTAAANQTNATVADNTIINANLHGLHVRSSDASTLDVTASNNLIDQPGIEGIRAQSSGTSAMTAQFNGNTITNAGANAVQAFSNDTSTLTLGATTNTITTPVADGFDVDSLGASTLNFTLTGNTLTNVGSDGIDSDASGTSLLTLLATGNTITMPAGNGFDLDSITTNNLAATLIGNSITNAGDDAVQADARLSGVLTLLATGNTITEPVLTGFDLASINDGSLNATLTGNTITYAVGPLVVNVDGVQASAANTSDLTLLATGNTITNPKQDGFDLRSTTTSTLDATLDLNTITGAVANAVLAFSTNGSAMTLLATNNTITSPGADGFDVDSALASTLAFTLTGNTITGAGSDGIDSDSSGTSVLTLVATGNTITTTVGDGFDLNSTGTSTLTTILDLSNITGYGGRGVLANEVAGSILTVNSTILTGLGNVIGAPGVLRYDAVGAPSGTVRINGANHNAATDLP